MGTVRVLLAALLISGTANVQASHLRTSTNKPDSSRNEAETTTARPPQQSSSVNVTHFNESDILDHIIEPLNNIVFSLDQYTIVQLTDLQLSIPSDIHLGDVDPDFSKMILNISSMLGSFELKGRYAIFGNNYMGMPVSSQGIIYINYINVTTKGFTSLAITPAALLALNYDFVYIPERLTVKIDPYYNDVMTEEVRLSNNILNEPIISIINTEIQNYLNYHIETHVNLILSKISVFTVGHKKEESFSNEPLNQNVQIGDLFDEFLMDVKGVVAENGRDKIRIPEFYRNFSEKLESQYINGTFLAEEGWVSGISTLRRMSNVSLSKKENVFTLSAGIEFSDLEMGYDKYKAKFLKTEVGGEMNGTFLHKVMILKVAMEPKEDGSCASSLSDLKAFKMNGYRIQNITNIGSLNWLQRRINNWLVGYFQIKIVKGIEKELSVAVETSLSQFDCGEYLPHLKILM